MRSALRLYPLLFVLLVSVFTGGTYALWPAAVTETGIYVLAVAMAIRYLRGSPWPADAIQIPFFAAAMLGIAQLVTGHSFYPMATWQSVMTWATLAFGFVVARDALADSKSMSRFKNLIPYIGAIIAVLAILQLFTADGKILWLYISPEIDPTSDKKPMGPFLNRDHYSAFIELLIPFALWRGLTDRKHSILCAVLGAIMYASVIAGASRTGFILATLELWAMPLLALAKGVKRKEAFRTLALVVLLACVCGSVVGWDVLSARLARDDSPWRRDVWTGALHMIWDRPVAGFGLGLETWASAYQRYAVFDSRNIVNAAHSDWLQWPGEGGLPLFALMAAVAARGVLLGLKSPWGMGVGFVFLHSIVDFPLQRLSIFLWLVVVLAALETSAGTVSQGEAIRTSLRVPSRSRAQ